MLASVLFVALWYLKIVQTGYDWIILCFLLAIELGPMVKMVRKY